MEEVAEFLYAENQLSEFGFLRYAYHTKAPRALIQLEDYGVEDIEFTIVDEIDKFDAYTQEEIDTMMERLKAWWIEYRRDILEEGLEQTGDADIKCPELDDAVTLSIITGSDKPEPSEFELINERTLLRMSINGIEFWASVLEFDLSTETILAVVQSPLDEGGLKTRSTFIAEFRNVSEIVHQ
jgi:hypothetical protein